MLLRRILYILSWALLFGATQQALAAPAPRLSRMSKVDSLTSSRIELEFSELPTYRIAPSGQRIDLFFSNASAAPTLHLLAEDDKIVKILLARSSKELMVSLLLRQVPANVTLAAHPGKATVEMEIFWEKASGSRPAIAFRISGLPSRQTRTNSTLPLLKSDYSGHWPSFFHGYQTPLLIDVEPPVSLPILPSFGFEQASAPFAAALKSLEEGIPAEGLSPTELLHKQLLLAEALLRSGSAEQSLAILERLPQQQFPAPLQQRAGYLHNLAQTLTNDPYGAMARHAELEKLLTNGPYRYPLQLLQGEIALIIGDGERALKNLHWQDSAWPKQLDTIRLLRIADVQVETGQSKQALAHYQKLITGDGLPKDKLFSLQQGARAFFENHHWEQAHILYQRLSILLQDRDSSSQALFLSNLATYQKGNQDQAMLQFRLLRENFPGTQGDRRAWMKMLDHGLATGEERHLLQGRRDYPVLIASITNRQLREEAIFKHGLVLYLHGASRQAIEVLGDFRRDFASSPLRNLTEALLAEILQPEMEKLIAGKDDLQAVVLLEKYRELLIRGDGIWPFLPELAKAFSRLGLFERGCRVYLYLLDHASNKDDAEKFYLPLTSLYFDRDEYALAEKYSKTYLQKYPQGADRSAHFLLRLRALNKLARFEEAVELLQDKQYPRSSAIELIATQIYWALGDYNQVIDFANRLGNRGEAIPPFGLLLEAEALRRLGHGQQALPLYEVLAEDGTFSDQANYRCGQILLAKGERTRALKIFQNLVEKGKDDLWRQLAGDFIAAETY